MTPLAPTLTYYQIRSPIIIQGIDADAMSTATSRKKALNLTLICDEFDLLSSCPPAFEEVICYAQGYGRQAMAKPCLLVDI